MSHAFKLDQSQNDFAKDLDRIFQNLDQPDISKEIEVIAKGDGRIKRMNSYEPPEPFEEI